PIYLKDRLPKIDYDQFISLVTAIQISTDYTISISERDQAQIILSDFLKYYENHFYQKDWNRLSAMWPVFHYLTHVANTLTDCGPGWVYWQFLIERL
ncbi:hypothetical protein L873DRAFT_1658270, partial [Choiromyces venosus 120613-1]